MIERKTASAVQPDGGHSCPEVGASIRPSERPKNVIVGNGLLRRADAAPAIGGRFFQAPELVRHPLAEGALQRQRRGIILIQLCW